MALWKKLYRSIFSLKAGPAHRVIFYYQGEDPTYLEDAHVTIFRSGVVEVCHRTEHVSTHVQNVEILWKGGGQILGSKGRSLTLIKSESSQ